MDVGSAVTQGLVGMQRSQYEINRSAQQIASAGVTKSSGSSDNEATESKSSASSENEVTESLVNIKAQTQVFNSSAKVVKAADETVGTLLNIKA